MPVSDRTKHATCAVFPFHACNFRATSTTLQRPTMADDRLGALESLLTAVEGAAAMHAQETAKGVVRASGSRMRVDSGRRRKSSLRCTSTKGASKSTCGRSPDSFESCFGISPLTADAWEVPDDPGPHVPLPCLNTSSSRGDLEGLVASHEQLVQPNLDRLALLLEDQRRVKEENQRRLEEATRQQVQQLAAIQMQLEAVQQRALRPFTNPRHTVQGPAVLGAPESAWMTPLTVEASTLLRTAAREVEQHPLRDAETALASPPSPLAHFERSIADFLCSYNQLVSEMDQSKGMQGVPPCKRLRSEC